MARVSKAQSQSQQEQRKSERLEVRVSLEQKRLFKKAAGAQGRTLSDFVIDALQSIAQKVIDEDEQLHLTRSDRKFFVKALLDPAKPNEALKSAYMRYREEVVYR